MDLPMGSGEDGRAITAATVTAGGCVGTGVGGGDMQEMSVAWTEGGGAGVEDDAGTFGALLAGGGEESAPGLPAAPRPKLKLKFKVGGGGTGS